MRRCITLAYGALAYLAFFIPTAYLVGFLADAGVPKTVDRGAGMPGPALVVDVVLLALFGLQHSAMARVGFKRAVRRWMPSSLERSTYVLVSGLTVALILALWRPMPAVLWDASGTVLEVAAWLGFAAGWGLALCATFGLSHLRLFGVTQIAAHACGGEHPGATLRRTLFYRIVRHPMTLGMLLAFWSIPLMTLGHLVFAAAMTLYCLLATVLEERDLVREFGDAYRDYRREVPALLPVLRPGICAPRRGSLLLEASLLTTGLVIAILLALRTLAAAADVGSAAAPLPPLQADSIEVDGVLRSYRIFDPDPRPTRTRPLVMALHGTGGSAARFQSFLGGALESVVTERNWLLVYPEAVEGAWNDCRKAARSAARSAGVDDVAFIGELVERLSREHHVDPERVFMLGFSGGGHMGIRVALEAGGLLRGLAVFSASLPDGDALVCADRGEPVPIQIVNGTRDLVNPYSGGEVLTLWGRRLGQVRSSQSTADYFRRRSPAADVELVAIERGGHAVPGFDSRLPSLVGRVDRSYDGVREAAAFFARQLSQAPASGSAGSD